MCSPEHLHLHLGVRGGPNCSALALASLQTCAALAGTLDGEEPILQPY